MRMLSSLANPTCMQGTGLRHTVYRAVDQPVKRKQSHSQRHTPSASPDDTIRAVQEAEIAAEELVAELDAAATTAVHLADSPTAHQHQQQQHTQFMVSSPSSIDPEPTSLLDSIKGNKVAMGGVAAAGIFLGGTFLIALGRVFAKYNSKEARRKRTVGKNKELVEGLNSLIVQGRAAITPTAVGRLRAASGFSAGEVFRKYLWYLLRERPFNTDAVADMVALKQALKLSDQEVAEALQARAQRVYDKYGNVMLETEGMTKAGIERKATCRALFSKLLFMAECEELLPQGSEAAKSVGIPAIFGATDDDTAKLRIVSLYQIDFGKLADMPTAEGPDD